ncbi:MAG TPA: hypothetical protein VI258_01895, partial [Rhodanobacteraceae bacterium]
MAPLFVLAAAFGASTASAQAQKGIVNPAPAEAQTAFQTITSSGPLNQIFIGVDLAAQIAHVGD